MAGILTKWSIYTPWLQSVFNLEMFFYKHIKYLILYYKRAIRYIINKTLKSFISNIYGRIWWRCMGWFSCDIFLYFYISQKLNIPNLNVFLIFLIAIIGGLVFAGLSVLGSLLSVIFLCSSDLPYIVYEFAKYPISIFSPIIAFVFRTSVYL